MALPSRSVVAALSPSDPFAPAPLGPLTLRNRIVKAATFEGMTPRNVVTDRLIEFHRRFAAGGVGMTTLAFCAVSDAGLEEMKTLTRLVQEAGARPSRE